MKRRLDGCFFHGAKVRFGRFDPSKAADGHAQEGCGFYFTSERSDAWTHAAPGGAILSARLRIDRLLPSAGRVSVTEVRRLVKASPVLNDLLINWDEDPDRAFDMAVHSMMSSGTGPKAVFDQIWYDFYRDHPAAYLTAVTGLGYDGAVIPRPGGITHVVMFNLDKIEIIEATPLPESGGPAPGPEPDLPLPRP